MGEGNVIKNTPFPQTRKSLLQDFQALGVKRGMTLMVHASMKSLGWVNGGAVAVVQALMDAVTSEGTIIFQTHSGNVSDPKGWGNPPVPEEWWDEVRDTMPAYDPQITPSYCLGILPEVFRSFPGVVRSEHPTLSMAAWGLNAEWVTESHPLAFSLGKRSPLQKMYDLDGHVLFIGTGYDTNTSFHLSEYLCGNHEVVEKGAPIMENGKRIWKTYLDIEFEDDDFDKIGEDFEKDYPIETGKVGMAGCKLFRQREAVDFATDWLKDARKGSGK